jgi:Gpi18-like mannosyltransferase
MATIILSIRNLWWNYWSLILVSAFTYVSLLFLLPEYHFVYDLKCWQDWSCLIHEHGLAAAYDPEISQINYMPLHLYILKVYTWLAGDTNAIREHINYLKAVPLFFEVLSIALLAAIPNNQEKRILYFIIGILNIGFLYNSMFWHQVDGILAFLLLVSFLYGMRRKTLTSIVFFMLAFNFKIQAICLLPLLGLLWLNRINARKAITYLALACLVEILIILPFLMNGNAKHIIQIVSNSYGHFEKTSLNAYNIWYLLLKDFPPHVSDNTTWLGITYHQYGLGMYIAAIILIIFPIIQCLVRSRFNITIGDLKEYRPGIPENDPAKKRNISIKFLVLSAALLPYIFFYFNTQMHERYIHCSLIFLTLLAFHYKHWALYLMVTFNYFLSLESLLSVNTFIGKASFLFGMKTQSVVFGIGLAWLFVLWYKEWKSMRYKPSAIHHP